jgi:hypothetical protein
MPATKSGPMIVISPVPLEKDFQRVTQIMVIHLVGPYAVETDLGIDGHHEIEHRRKRPASGIRGGQCLVGDACLRSVGFRHEAACWMRFQTQQCNDPLCRELF